MYKIAHMYKDRKKAPKREQKIYQHSYATAHLKQ